jgi:hypothetical protein
LREGVGKISAITHQSRDDGRELISSSEEVVEVENERSRDFNIGTRNRVFHSRYAAISKLDFSVCHLFPFAKVMSVPLP